jgi:hypothetical protein
MEWYELNGHPTDAALPPLQAASEEAALGTFARELNLKLDFAEEGETGEYVLTNTSTWKEWWVAISGLSEEPALREDRSWRSMFHHRAWLG